MKFIFFETGDGSPSLRNLEVDELYHSKAGAYFEALEKYSKALCINDVKSPVIFDVCFGLGYNVAAAIDFLEVKEAFFVCFENDLDVLEKLLELDFDSVGFNLVKRAVSFYLSGNNDFVIDGFRFVFEVGDARELIKKYRVVADFVFFDPFSPKRQPWMWEVSFIEDVFSSMKSFSKIATYSYSRVARDNFVSAGFSLVDGPVVGRRSPSLIGVKQNFIK